MLAVGRGISSNGQPWFKCCRVISSKAQDSTRITPCYKNNVSNNIIAIESSESSSTYMSLTGFNSVNGKNGNFDNTFKANIGV
jgi:hypothetical protein